MHCNLAIVGEDLDAGAVDEDVELYYAVDGIQLYFFAFTTKHFVFDIVGQGIAAKIEDNLGDGAELNLGLDFKEFGGYCGEELFARL